MNRFFSADYVLPAVGAPIKNGVVKVGEDGEILGVFAPEEIEIEGEINVRQGILVPGFVNTHCHLELSHLKGQIRRHTGLVAFIEQVMDGRSSDEVTIQAAMQEADQAMFANGIVAVGDHANTGASASVKAKSHIHYHTFVEVMGFDATQAADRLEAARAVADEFADTPASLTPHSPYSVSKTLLNLYREAMQDKENAVVSIHNQESNEENKLFRYKTGAFVDFYKQRGIDITEFKAQSRNSLQTTIPHLPRTNPIILVHNTFTSSRDIFYLERMGKRVTWCLCPRANQYIEGILPKVRNFMQGEFPIALGTDSLASNDGLCILSELKALHEAFDELDLRKTVKWATINGARALGIDDRYGSLEKGKRPGLNLLTDVKGFDLTSKTRVERLV